jgi:DNA-binding transcriptional MerR regulator
MSYRVKSVAQLTGIPRPTLVAWERRYALLEPRRSEAGYRIYTDEDVAYLRALKVLVDQGVAISEAISRVSTAPKLSVPAGVGSALPLVPGLVDTLVAFDREAAAPLLRRTEQLPFLEALMDVWHPVLLEIGRRWQDGEISAAQEHFVAGVAREAYGSMLRSIGYGGQNGPVAVCACLPGERHDLPLMAVTIQLALGGWRVVWLGADTPLPDLCAYVAGHAPDVVCLSAVVLEPEAVLNLARTVLGSAAPAARVVLGGPAAMAIRGREPPRLWVCQSAGEVMSRWAQRLPVA